MLISTKRSFAVSYPTCQGRGKPVSFVGGAFRIGYGLGLPLTWGAVWASLALRMVRACPCPGVVGESSIAPLSTKHKTEQKNAQGLPLSSHDSSGRFSRAT